jgi:predicted Zn finger-like uncharacterized protein
MYTECPHCQTLFRISSEQLKIATGKVRCSQCHRIFNALQNLHEAPTDQPSDTQAKREEEIDWRVRLDDPAILDPSGDSFELTTNQLYAVNKLGETLEDSELSSFLVQENGLETQPEYLTSSSDSQISGLLDSEASPVVSLIKADEDDAPDKVAPDHADSPLTSIQKMYARREAVATAATNQAKAELATSVPEPSTPSLTELSTAQAKQPASAVSKVQDQVATPYTIDQMFEKEPVNYAAVGWGLGSLLLACMMILQLAWHYRDQVIQKDIGRQMLTQMCQIIGCTVPVRRDTSRILVQQRDLRAHPQRSNALLLQLHMVNRARFEQPYPDLHLSLFNDAEKLIAARTFSPQEYLPGNPTENHLMQRFQSVQVRLELLDPGKDVTGFKFEFL